MKIDNLSPLCMAVVAASSDIRSRVSSVTRGRHSLALG